LVKSQEPRPRINAPDYCRESFDYLTSVHAWQPPF
jgi:hypothetical protein